MDTAQIEKLKALALAASPGPWQWWTSNSTLRLTAANGRDGGVLSAWPHHGLADLACSREDQAFIEASNPATVLELIAKIDRAERALLRAGFQDHGAQEWKPPIGKPPVLIEVPALTAEAEKDAERYRWLRDRPEIPDAAVIDVAVWENCEGTSLRGEELDRSLDAAIGAHTKAETEKDQHD